MFVYLALTENGATIVAVVLFETLHTKVKILLC